MDALRSAFNDFVSFLPDLVAGLVLLAVGWVIAVLVSQGLRRLLPRVGFDRFLARHKLVNKPADAHSGSRAVGTAAAWLIFLVALMQAASTWRLGSIANGIGRVIGYLPNILAAVLIFGGAWIVSNWVADRLRPSPAAQSSDEQRASMAILPGAVRAAILTIGVFIALRQLLIAPEILTIAFTLVFGAIAVATALAFGLGGRRAAERMTADWYEKQQMRRRGARAEGAEREERPGVH